jgi:hypothetical protein
MIAHEKQRYFSYRLDAQIKLMKLGIKAKPMFIIAA